MSNMKISKLVKYFKNNKFKHRKAINIDNNTKLLIFEAFLEKSKSMSINRFCKYLTPFGVSISSIKKIIKIWKTLNNPLSLEEWNNYTSNNYKNRYTNSYRKPKINSFTKEQFDYIEKLRNNNKSMGYKTFTNELINPENFDKYKTVFWDEIISYRQFYAIIHYLKLPKALTKKQKLWLLQKMKKEWIFKAYVAKMKYTYSSFKSLHHWQLDIKYLTDIPNYVALWLDRIYLYQITFRDYKTWLTIVFYWNNRDKTRVFIALSMFKYLLELVWVGPKKVTIQIDWWAEFSNLKINWTKWALIEYIEKEFAWYRLIDRKEQNWHVESFHNLIEKHLFDTKKVSNLKSKIKSNKDKHKIIPLISDYIRNFNMYWYSSYQPRYATFWKKSPIQIAKQDIPWLRIDLIEKYFLAYDVDCAFNMKKPSSFLTLFKSAIHYNEEVVANQQKITTITNSYAYFDYFSSLFSSGHIWVDWYKMEFP